ncbi:hypothetical protein C8J95_10627 [Elizabethkingia sp. YR214]|nr:hypothetical protein C8J95_10627 [Elizabethkingia sp. YR214]
MEFMGNITINNARITEKTDYDMSITLNLSNIISTGSYGSFYNCSTEGNSFNNTFSNVVFNGRNGGLASYAGIMLDGYARTDGYYVPMIRNITGLPIAYNLKCLACYTYS